MPGLPVLHSRDLVNWEFMSYALDRLDLGPEFRLEGGKEIYGRASGRRVSAITTARFTSSATSTGRRRSSSRATSPRGPWTRTPMKRSLHDLSVLFDDDGKVVRRLGLPGHPPRAARQHAHRHRARAPSACSSRRTPAWARAAHFYKIDGKYFITSAWYAGRMRHAARARRSSRRAVGGEPGDQRRRDVRHCARAIALRGNGNDPQIVVTRRQSDRARAHVDAPGRHRAERRPASGGASR